MSKLTLEGVHPALDGTYDFDETYFTNWELHAIKQLTGITAGRLEQAFADLDNDIIVALAMVALMRDGKVTSQTPWSSEQVHALWRAPTGKISLDFGEGDDADPPTVSAPEGAESESNGSSGTGSSDVLEILDSVPSPTGSPR